MRLSLVMPYRMNLFLCLCFSPDLSHSAIVQYCLPAMGGWFARHTAHCSCIELNTLGTVLVAAPIRGCCHTIMGYPNMSTSTVAFNGMGKQCSLLRRQIDCSCSPVSYVCLSGACALLAPSLPPLFLLLPRALLPCPLLTQPCKQPVQTSSCRLDKFSVIIKALPLLSFPPPSPPHLNIPAVHMFPSIARLALERRPQGTSTTIQWLTPA